MGRLGIWIVTFVAIAVAVAFALRPVCVPLSPEDLAGFNTQQIDGRWYQCKTWLSRQFFF